MGFTFVIQNAEIKQLNAKNLNPNQIVVVVGYKNEMVEKHLENENLTFAIQKEQNGTAHAVMQCHDSLKNFEGQTLILSGDVPLIKKDELDKLVNDCLDKNVCKVTLQLFSCIPPIN